MFLAVDEKHKGFGNLSKILNVFKKIQKKNDFAIIFGKGLAKYRG